MLTRNKRTHPQLRHKIQLSIFLSQPMDPMSVRGSERMTSHERADSSGPPTAQSSPSPIGAMGSPTTMEEVKIACKSIGWPGACGTMRLALNLGRSGARRRPTTSTRDSPRLAACLGETIDQIYPYRFRGPCHSPAQCFFSLCVYVHHTLWRLARAPPFASPVCVCFQLRCHSTAKS